MARVNKTRYAILGLLSSKPMSGYDIKKTIENNTSFFWSESNGQLYPILNQLVNEELVTCTIDFKSGKRKRKVYTLTELGQSELNNWLANSIDPVPYRDELLLKLFFGHNVKTKINIEHLQKEIFHLKKSLTELKNTHKDPNNNTVYQDIIENAGRILIEARIKWCEQTLQTLQHQQNQNEIFT